MKHKTFAIIGGDLRNIYLAKHLQNDGHIVNLYGFSNYKDADLNFCNTLQDAVSESDVIIGPIPCSRDNISLNNQFHHNTITLDEVFRALNSSQIFIAGVITNEIEVLAKNHDIRIFDLLNCEEMAILNAIPTSEGALQIAFEEMPITLHDCNAMVIGYGRIGKVLSKMLYGIGANVYTASRKQEHLSYIKALGYNPVLLNNLSNYLNNMDVIFNTAPHIILNKSNIHHLKKDCLVIDLASKPFGIDFDYAKSCGIKAISALSLPGRVAPSTTARYVMQTIYHLLDI